MMMMFWTSLEVPVPRQLPGEKECDSLSGQVSLNLLFVNAVLPSLGPYFDPSFH